jgi:hypothetical protein
MMRRIMFLLGLTFVMLIGSVLQANAVADVTSYSTGCSSFSASGTTNAPYLVVEVYNPGTGLDLYLAAQPATSPFSLTVTYPAQSAGTDLEFWVWGSPTNDPDDWDSEPFFYTEANCTQRKELGAPGIPDGFVFASIICNTPVYNTPAGQPVGDAAVTAGQTWYVNPKPVDGDDGKQWTEIYVSSTTNPYIPTACVQ